MTVRHAALPIAAVLVLGLAVYLWFAVRAPPEVVEPRSPPRTPSTVAAQPPASPPGPAVSGPPSSSDRPRWTTDPTPGNEPTVYVPPPPAYAADHNLAKPQLDTLMDEANKAYDHGDYEQAKAVASRMLSTYPTNVRMLRIMVSASCIDGDLDTAKASFAKLPPADQDQMKTRCARYGVTLGDKP